MHMRSALCLVVVTAFAGCEKAAPVATNLSAPVNAASSQPSEQPQPATGDPSFVSAPDSPPPDLGTRSAGEDWPAFLGPRGDSTSIEQGIITQWNEKPHRIVWQRPLGVGYGMPTISRGRLFQFGRYDGQARVTCHNSETGEELWQFEYPTGYEDFYGYNNGPRCCPIVDEGLVYAFGAEGLLHALRAEDGKPVWKVDTAQQFGVIQNFFGVGSTPLIYKDLLIVQIGGSPPESREAPPGQLNMVQSNGTCVVAFDKRTGQVKYKVGDDLASYAGPVVARIDGRDWCFVLARGGLLGFDPATGKQEFHYPWRDEGLESVNASNPVVIGDLVFISECYGPGSSLLKVRPGGYDVVWTDAERRRDKAMQTHWNTCIHRDGYLYGSSGRHTANAELRCIDVKTGEIKWKQPELTRSSLLFVEGHFICLTEYGDLLLLRATPEKFDVVGQLTLLDPTAGPQPAGTEPVRLLKYPAWAAPVLSHGLLYVRGDDRLVCLELIPPGKE